MTNEIGSNSTQQKKGTAQNINKSSTSISSFLNSKLIKMYNISQDHLYIQLINKIIPISPSVKKSKRKHHEGIEVKDIGFDEEDQFIDKLYSISEISSELPELFEYYKYYTQEPILYMEDEFEIMIDYQDRKKAFIYNRLKNVLELSDTVKTISELEKVNKEKKVHEVGNILTFLSKSDAMKNFNQKQKQKDNESYYFQEISQRLISYYGLSRMKTISKIDKHFKLLPHTVSFHRHKKISELCKTPTLKNALESTNISTKNTFVKKNKNIEHKRYGSTQSGCQQRMLKVKMKRWTSTEGVDTEKQDLRREKTRTRKYKKVKTKGGENIYTEIKENIEDMRRKINKEKKAIYQTASGSRFIKGKKK